jgi:glutamate synthase domain-containing protein 3
MARICEKNRCPTGIATHDPKFKAKYKGSPEHVVRLLEDLADRVRDQLAAVGAHSLGDIKGRAEFLRPRPRHEALIASRGIRLDRFLNLPPYEPKRRGSLFEGGVSELNERIVEDAAAAIDDGTPVHLSYDVHSTDRAVLARLAGALAERSRRARMERISAGVDLPDFEPHTLPEGTIRVDLRGSAGQGFAAFLVGGVDVTLHGEANDSVCKSMSGGRVVIRPDPEATFEAETNVIIGNAALYGATGGTLYVRGLAGDRFCVRNSGAVAVVEGAGLHACEYMTGGTVVILDMVSHNVGAGMTGGRLFLRRERERHLNHQYVVADPMLPADREELRAILQDYLEATDSRTVATILAAWDSQSDAFGQYIPRAVLALRERQSRDGAQALTVVS